MNTHKEIRSRSKDRMSRLALSVASIAIVLGACNTGPSPEELARDKALADNERLTRELEARDSLIGSMTLSFTEIERNIALMDERQEVVNNATASEMDLDKRNKIVQDLQLMNGLMKDSRERIADLTKRLDKSKIDAGGLRKKLKDLDMQLASRDSSLANMKDELMARDFKITQINEQLTSIELEVAKREAIIAQQEGELNKVFYVTGTFKELEAKGVLTKEGGLVGIGKHTSLRDDASASAFNEGDKREVHRIMLGTDKAKLVTEHPSSSYKLVEEGDQFAYLEIKDADAFWKLSKYVVVEVK
ncbi:MAG: hypothetical protein WAU70_09085 [Flavobacteriales bacterium]